jgi:hypothetical protein
VIHAEAGHDDISRLGMGITYGQDKSGKARCKPQAVGDKKDNQRQARTPHGRNPFGKDSGIFPLDEQKQRHGQVFRTIEGVNRGSDCQAGNIVRRSRNRVGGSATGPGGKRKVESSQASFRFELKTAAALAPSSGFAKHSKPIC